MYEMKFNKVFFNEYLFRIQYFYLERNCLYLKCDTYIKGENYIVVVANDIRP